MCDDSNCQMISGEIVRLACLRLSAVTDTLATLDEARRSGCVRTLGEFIQQVKTPTDAKRHARSLYGQDGYDDAKKRLPVWILCGVGGTTQKTITPNGLITIDIDHIDGHERQVKEKLCELPFIALCCLSISGHGVYALAYAPDHVGNAEEIKSEIYSVVACYLSAATHINIHVKDATIPANAACIDTACTDVSRKRFETYDSEIYVADKVKAFEPISALIAKKWQKSRIKTLAEKMGYRDVMPGHAAVGAVLALAAASARLMLWDRDITTQNECYQARIGVVVLGETGEGKNRIDSAVQIVADRLDIQCGNSKSTADMAFRACLACNTLATDEETKKPVWKAKQVRDVKPFIEVTDEAYSAISANKQALYSMEKPAQRRLLLDTHYNPQTTRKDSLPDYKFTPSYQYVCFSQFDSYAEAIAGDRTDTGDGRRELLCDLPKIDADGLPLEVAIFRARLDTPASDLDAVSDALKQAHEENRRRVNARFEACSVESLTVREIEGKSKYSDFPAYDYENRPLCQFTFFRCLEGLPDTAKKDAFTHFANLATLSAYLEGRNAITTSDILAGAAIARASFALRERLAERCSEIALDAKADKTTAWLIEYWKKDGKKVSQQGYTKAKINNGIGIGPSAAIVETWETANLIEYYEGTNKYCRRGTADELAQKLADIETTSAMKSKAGALVNRLTLQWDTSNEKPFERKGRPDFAQDTPDAQRIRVGEMIAKTLEGGKAGTFVKGQRQTCLYRLRNVLTGQGMWGPVALDILATLARESGLDEREIARTLTKWG